MPSNSEGPGKPIPTNTKIYLSNLEHNLVSKHVEYSDKQMGASYPLLCNKDVKFMKIGTIILIGMMISAFINLNMTRTK